MEVREKVINGNRWKIVNEYWENSRAWGHKTTLIRNGYDYNSYKVRYYNRTWESYKFQTCMLGAVRNIRDEELERFIKNYKLKNGMIRFKRGEKEKAIKEFDDTDIAKELEELLKTIRERRFD